MSVRAHLNMIKDSNLLVESDLNNIFDKINLLSAADIAKESEAVADLLFNLTKLMPTNNDHILSKFCCLLCYILENSTVPLQSSSSEHLFEYLISKLSTCGTWVLSDVLVTLSCFLNSTPPLTLDQVNILLKEDSILLISSELYVQDKSIQYNALRCLFALLKNDSETVLMSEKIGACYLRCLSLLKESSNEDHKINAKISVCSLKCLQLIFSYEIAVVTNVGEILGILKSFSFYGFPGQKSLHGFDLIPTLTLPEAAAFHESLSESDASHSMLRKQKKNRRRVKKNHHQRASHPSKIEKTEELENNVADNHFSVSNFTSSSYRDSKIKSSSSDSEFSDIDSQTSGTRVILASVRQNAYQTLQILVKLVHKKTMFSYWTAFLPDHPAVSVNQTLFYSVLKDSAPQVRLSALGLLSEMMRGSKQYLILADGRSTRHSAFTSLSSILASMITETHRCLHLSLISEKSPMVLLQILKCYAVLAENVPYNKLNGEILFKYLKHMKGLFYHKDIQVQVASMAVFTCLLNSNQTPEELEDIILSTDVDCAFDSSASVNLPTEGHQLPWIIDMCRQKIYNADHMTIKIQSLQLFSSVTGKYFQKSKSFLHIIKDVIFFCLKNSEPNLQYHGVKLMDVVGRCSNDSYNLEKSNVLASQIFLDVVTDPLIKCLTDEEQKPLQAAVCDCLSTFPAKHFASLPSKLQILYISILLGLASDSNANVRGSAIRCLGIFCLFPSILEDASFYEDLCRVLVTTVKDSNVNVRFKASWALGNLSDALFLKGDPAKEMSVQLYLSIGMACIEYSKDCDRVKANAVRALGNFLHFLPQQYLSSPKILEFIEKANETLLCALSASFMKVCWNACYALKSMMKNNCLLELEVIKTETILNALVSVLKKSPNFKVRISCVQAASSLRCRSQYGAAFTHLWKQILLSLVSATKDANFKEIKHQENLCEQLCHSFCHLISLVTLQDLSAVEEDTLMAKEMLLTSMWKFGTHLTEEKSAHVSTALKNVELLSQLLETSHVVLVTLQDVLTQAIIACNQLDLCQNIEN